MQNLTITRTNGNIVRNLAGEDHISGLVFYSATLPTATEGVAGFTTTERIHAISSIETAEKYGITADVAAWETKVLHYTLASIFNMNPGVSLYVGIFKPATGGANAFSEIKQMQNYAGGRLRQVGVWNGAVELSDTLVNSLQSVRAPRSKRRTSPCRYSTLRKSPTLRHFPQTSPRSDAAVCR